MRDSTKTWLWIGGAAALVWYLSRKSGSLKGLGDADPDKLDVSRDSDLVDRVQLHAHPEIPQELGRLNERTPDIMITDHAHLIRQL